MFRSLRLALATIVLAAGILATSTAFAAPAPWQRVTVTLHADQAGGVMLVGAELRPKAKLPASAELAVPAGSQLLWIGQILGGAASADPALEYTKTTVGSSDLYRFTLTRSRTAQIEVKAPAPAAVDATTQRSTLQWTSAHAVPEVTLSARIPKGALIVEPATGASVGTDGSGESEYSRTVKGVKPGDKLGLVFAYTVPIPATSGAGSTGSDSTVLIVIAALLALAVILVIAIRARMRPSSGPGEGDDRFGSMPEPIEADEASEPFAVEEDGAEEARPVRSGGAKKGLATAIVLGVLAILVAIVTLQSAKPQVSGDTISRVFGAGQPCATADVALAVPGGADPVEIAETLFAAIKPLAGMNTATYNVRTSRIEVGFCESSSSEEKVRAALQPTGLVVAGSAGTTPVAE